MSIISVDVKSRVPIYEQIVESVRDAVLKGLLLTDDPLPSVRSLASELAINPNTIQKAYTELDKLKIVYTVPGRGSFIASNTKEIENEHIEKILSEIRSSFAEMRSLGVEKEKIMEILDEVWEGEE